MKIYKKNSSFSRTVFDLAKGKEKLKELEKESQSPNFWKNRERAAQISQELANLNEEFKKFDFFKKELEELKELEKLTKGDSKIEKEIEEKCRDLALEISQEEFRIFLSGKYDKRSAILSISAGAGGQDAQDWTAMLLRMYERYCQRKGFKTKILHQSFGQGVGPENRIGAKQVSLEIQGKYVYGFLKKESGVHRLVRISPFSAQKLRHTSFALVEVLPEISKVEEEEIKIRPEELRLETFRASGPGGQYVNRRESAVRIIHLPTQITVSCQTERLQGLNKERAMKVLYAKLYQLKEKEREKEISKIKGKTLSIEWGSQIRSYVLEPYQLVKDSRTNVETSDVDGVLDGKLDEFIEAEIKKQNS